MEHFAHVYAVTYELGARRLDAGHDEIQTLRRARLRLRHPLAEMDGALRARRGELHYAPVITVGEVRIESPAEASVEALGTIDVGHGKHDDLELHIRRPCSRDSSCVF